jgi:hypothetical protein
MSASGATVTPMNVPTADELAESQADLNEYLAYMIMARRSMSGGTSIAR